MAVQCWKLIDFGVAAKVGARLHDSALLSVCVCAVEQGRCRGQGRYTRMLTVLDVCIALATDARLSARLLGGNVYSGTRQQPAHSDLPKFTL